jgi:flagellar biogenesis protein FliO
MTLIETAQLLGNFGEFFGAIAVVATLVYLAVQVRYSRNALNREASVLKILSLTAMRKLLHDPRSE